MDTCPPFRSPAELDPYTYVNANFYVKYLPGRGDPYHRPVIVSTAAVSDLAGIPNPRAVIVLGRNESIDQLPDSEVIDDKQRAGYYNGSSEKLAFRSVIVVPEENLLGSKAGGLSDGETNATHCWAVRTFAEAVRSGISSNTPEGRRSFAAYEKSVLTLNRWSSYGRPTETEWFGLGAQAYLDCGGNFTSSQLGEYDPSLRDVVEFSFKKVKITNADVLAEITSNPTCPANSTIVTPPTPPFIRPTLAIWIILVIVIILQVMILFFLVLRRYPLNRPLAKLYNSQERKWKHLLKKDHAEFVLWTTALQVWKVKISGPREGLVSTVEAFVDREHSAWLESVKSHRFPWYKRAQLIFDFFACWVVDGCVIVVCYYSGVVTFWQLIFIGVLLHLTGLGMFIAAVLVREEGRFNQIKEIVGTYNEESPGNRMWQVRPVPNPKSESHRDKLVWGLAIVEIGPPRSRLS
ncbi:hypothetical protein BJ742DRAFT_871381 [Cladochytrium replicatum]|nr:hypothetical protein BJ742DRAFT_871381 [Cladochytrium replicatum]